MDRASFRCSSVVALGGSTGSLESLLHIVASLPADMPAAVIVAFHLPPRASFRSELPKVLQRASRVRVRWATAGAHVVEGGIFVAPQDCDTTIDRLGRLSVEPSTAKSRPSVDALFTSVARYGEADSIGVVLSGALDDGAIGAAAIQAAGGIVIAQDRASCGCFSMPAAAIAKGGVHHVMPSRKIPAALVALTTAAGARAWFAVERDSIYRATAAV